MPPGKAHLCIGKPKMTLAGFSRGKWVFRHYE